LRGLRELRNGSLAAPISTSQKGARSRNFLVEKSKSAHTQDMGVLAYSFIGRKNGIFIVMST
jgi:hypothetical protein